MLETPWHALLLAAENRIPTRSIGGVILLILRDTDFYALDDASFFARQAIPTISPANLNALVLHVISTALSLLSVILFVSAMFQSKVAAHWSRVVTYTAATSILLSLVIDITFFSAAKTTFGQSASLRLGSAIWFTLAAWAMLLSAMTYHLLFKNEFQHYKISDPEANIEQFQAMGNEANGRRSSFGDKFHNFTTSRGNLQNTAFTEGLPAVSNNTRAVLVDQDMQLTSVLSEPRGNGTNESDTSPSTPSRTTPNVVSVPFIAALRRVSTFNVSWKTLQRSRQSSMNPPESHALPDSYTYIPPKRPGSK